MAFAFISEQNRLAQPNLNYVWDSGSMSWVKMTQPTGGAGGTVDQGAAGADPWLVHVENAAGADAVNIQDGGNSITVDGAVTVSATDLDIRNLVFATDKVDVSGSSIAVDTTGLATDTNQTDGSQKTQIVDGSGNVIGATSNALDVNIKSSTSLAVTGPLTDTQLRATPVPVSGTVTASAQPGVDIGDVTVNNAAGASAVNIQDGGNTITVDGAVTVSSTDLDIRNLVFATDTVDVSGSSVTATVSATNLDIRDLVFATDKVDITGSSVTATITGSAEAQADVLAVDGNAGYTDGDLAKNLTQTSDGRLRVIAAGIVNDTVNNGLTIGSNAGLSLTADGRLRVATANESYNLTPWGDPFSWGNNGLDVGKHPLTAW